MPLLRALPCRTNVYRAFSYLPVVDFEAGAKGHAGQTRSAHQAARARCKVRAEEAAPSQGAWELEGPCSEGACNGQSKIWGLHRLYDPLKFI